LPPYLKPELLQLPQYIIDLVGSLYDEGQDDESICAATVQAWLEKNNPASLAGICEGDCTRLLLFPKTGKASAVGEESLILDF
jgi:hypothetical protein